MEYINQFSNVIDNINWATRTFGPKCVTENQAAKPTPPPLKAPEKKTHVIEVMPDEPLPEGYQDYRPHLQRDGLILFSWEIIGDDIKIVWLRSNGNMFKYQTWIDNEGELTTACPEERYSEGRPYTKEKPDFIIYTAPRDLTSNTRGLFAAKLRASGVSVNFDYEFTLGKQKTAREAAVYDRIESRPCLSADETELLEAYRQLDNNFKLEFKEYAKSLLKGQI